MSTYFLPEAYAEDLDATTAELKQGDYWNAERLRLSLLYQYDVYRLAYERAAMIPRQTVRFLDVGCGPARKHQQFQAACRNIELTLMDQPTVKELALKYCPPGGVHFL